MNFFELLYIFFRKNMIHFSYPEEKEDHFMDISRFTDYRNKIVGACSTVIVGKEETIQNVLVCFVCSGHVLLEDVPGTGKTMLLRAFAKAVGGGFKRIQFTPDLLPSDLTGINFYDQKQGDFRFRPGPLFSNIFLADEINRATPRTQSSLLEAMEERQITVDGVTTPLDEPFMVMATQNPVESYGTFPLPEAQTDRFFMRLRLGYMTREQELSVIGRRSALDLIAELPQAVTADETAWIKSSYPAVTFSESVAGYLMDIVAATRGESRFLTGVSTRGAIALYKAAQVTAAFCGRDYVIPEDVKSVALPVLAHRITAGTARAADVELRLTELLNGIPVPTEVI